MNVLQVGDVCLGRGCKVLSVMRFCATGNISRSRQQSILSVTVSSPVRGPFSPFLGPGPWLVCALAPELSRIVRPLASLGKA